MPGRKTEKTKAKNKIIKLYFCPECKSLLVKRQNYSTQIVGIKGKKCSKCGLDLSKDFVF